MLKNGTFASPTTSSASACSDLERIQSVAIEPVRRQNLERTQAARA
jgi:hypothetical protein